MIKPFYEKNDIIYQVLVLIENQPVVVDLCYSGNKKEDENFEALEFEFSTVSEDNEIKDEIVDAYNKILENGLEETIVKFLVDHYKGTDIKFDPNHYQF
jgi:hypothetical protein